ncbi:hypothetical protein Mgra_00009201 [Meloidogyne graminicola]|uniref:LIM zinc-binding domain-containing protein n=1 Tax=Meloidogyne graminicola TaxID=189291 RepID=A0A8S9ZDL9_9BILA|nr:hypothetical protein Mgra_00009201 [Meloidogyne graminicola]
MMTEFSSLSTENNLATTNVDNISSILLNNASNILSNSNIEQTEQEQLSVQSLQLQHQLLLIENKSINQHLTNLQQTIGLNIYSGISSNNSLNNDILINKRKVESECNGIIIPSFCQQMISENKLECKLEPEHLINKTQIAMAPTGPCASCHMPIVDQHFLFVDSHSWHLNCAHCAVCFRNLENFKEDGDVEEGYFNNKNICFAKDGFLFCRRDYLMKYGKKCQKCILPIERGDLVMKVPVNGADEILFHIQCNFDFFNQMG